MTTIDKPVRILILRGGAIGDFILTLPAMRALRTRWPRAFIELIGYPHMAGLALADGLVDRVDSLDRANMATLFSWTPRIEPVHAEHLRSFDILVNYLHDPDGVLRRNLEDAGARHVVSGSPLVEGCHAVDFLMRPLRDLAVYPEGEAVPLLEMPAEGVKRGKRWLEEHGLQGEVWALHPGSGSPGKTWPAERFAEVARRIMATPGACCFFLLGEADEQAGALLERELPDVPVCRGKSLVDVAEIMSRANGYIGNDSGISHLAAALRLPVICLFGPTNPEIWAPRGAHVRIVQSPTDEIGDIRVEDVLKTRWSLRRPGMREAGS